MEIFLCYKMWKGIIIHLCRLFSSLFLPSSLVFKSLCSCRGLSHCSILCNRRLACKCLKRNGVLFPCYVYDGGLLKTLQWHSCLPVSEGHWRPEEELKAGRSCCGSSDGDLSTAVILGDPAAVYCWIKDAVLQQNETELMFLDLSLTGRWAGRRRCPGTKQEDF